MHRYVAMYLVFLTLLGCQRQAAEVPQEPIGNTAGPAARSSTSIETKAAFPGAENPGLLRQREKAIARLYSVGVYPQPGGQLKMYRLNEEAVQKRAAGLRILGFSTIVGDDEFGYSSGRGTDELTDQIFLENMKWFPEITSLSLISTDLTDEGMKAVLGMPHLESFRLLHLFPPVHPCLITDDGMKSLAQCETLRDLTFLGTKLTDAGVEHLSHLPNLKRISIEATYITPNCLRHLVIAPSLETILIRGNRRVHGSLSYRDIPDYDLLCTPIIPSVAQNMAAAHGILRNVRIEETLTVDPSVLEALCRTPTVERIEMRFHANWESASALAALRGQEHLKYLRCFQTWNATADAIRVLENVQNESVRLAVSGQVLTIPEWVKWAKQETAQ